MEGVYRFLEKKLWLFILISLVLSIGIRLPFLGRPLSGHHEWLTSTSLRHIQVFYESGPASVHYSPSLTYGNAADKNINYGLALSDSKGNLYYLSFPPFAFIFPYLFFKILHIYPSVLALELFNLLFHLLTAWTVFLIVRRLTEGTDGKNNLMGAALAFLVYLFSPGPLWFQSNVYMSDTIVQPFFTAGILCFLSIIRQKKPQWLYFVFFSIITFLMAYTEWLGVFFAFTVFLYGLFHFKQKGMLWLSALSAVAVTGALLFTVWQYSGIAGLSAYLDYAKAKFLFRTGDVRYASNGLGFQSPIAWLNIFVNYIGGFLPAFILAGFLAGRAKKVQNKGEKHTNVSVKAILIMSTVPVLLHHLVFFNFTSIHDFAALKGGVFIAICCGLLYHKMELKKMAQSADYLKIQRREAVILIGILVFSCIQFWTINSFESHKRYSTLGKAIRAEVKQDEVVFIQAENFSLDPQLVLYAHRNLAWYEGEAQARDLIRKNGVSNGVIIQVDSHQSGIAQVKRFSLKESP